MVNSKDFILNNHAHVLIIPINVSKKDVLNYKLLTIAKNETKLFLSKLEQTKAQIIIRTRPDFLFYFTQTSSKTLLTHKNSILFPGIMSRLEHFKDAGVDAIWMSPIFTSPMIDFGYDISDFYNIHEEYGNMTQFLDLLNRAHELGM